MTRVAPGSPDGTTGAPFTSVSSRKIVPAPARARPRAEGQLHADGGQLERPAVGGLLQCGPVHGVSTQPSCWMIPIFCQTLRAMSEVSASIPSTASSTSPSVVCSANSAALLPTSESISVQKSR